MGLPFEEEGARKLSLDHFFLDQDGIPTLVEVKEVLTPDYDVKLLVKCWIMQLMQLPSFPWKKYVRKLTPSMMN